jgi:hypothetical protein
MRILIPFLIAFPVALLVSPIGDPQFVFSVCLVSFLIGIPIVFKILFD